MFAGNTIRFTWVDPSQSVCVTHMDSSRDKIQINDEGGMSVEPEVLQKILVDERVKKTQKRLTTKQIKEDIQYLPGEYMLKKINEDLKNKKNMKGMSGGGKKIDIDMITERMNKLISKLS